MRFTTTSNCSGSQFQVPIVTDAWADPANREALTSLVETAAQSLNYRTFAPQYELRLVRRDDREFLQLHKHDRVGAAAALAKGVLCCDRAGRAEERDLERLYALQFLKEQDHHLEPARELLTAQARAAHWPDPALRPDLTAQQRTLGTEHPWEGWDMQAIARATAARLGAWVREPDAQQRQHRLADRGDLLAQIEALVAMEGVAAPERRIHAPVRAGDGIDRGLLAMRHFDAEPDAALLRPDRVADAADRAARNAQLNRLGVRQPLSDFDADAPAALLQADAHGSNATAHSDNF